MATTAISVVSVTQDGRQLTASGYDGMDAVKRHLADRLQHTGHTSYASFVIICTIDDGYSTTTCHHLSPITARRLIAAQGC